MPPVTVLDRLMAVVLDPGEVRLARPAERRPDGVMEARLIPLHSQQVVPALVPDLGDDLLLASGGGDGDRRPLQLQHLEQLGDGGDLVRPVGDRLLAEDQPVLGRPRTDQVQAPAERPPRGRPDGLAVDGDVTQPGRLARLGHPAGHASPNACGSSRAKTR